MENEQIQLPKEGQQTGSDAQKTEASPPIAPVNVGKVDPKENSGASEADKKKRKRKPLSCFDIWTIILASLGILVAAGTGAAIFWQARISAWTLGEIKKGGTDTHDLAVAAKTQSDKMSNMADAADKIRQAAQDMVTQDQRIADNAQNALAESNRQNKETLNLLQQQLTDDEIKEAAQLDVQDIKLTAIDIPNKPDAIYVQLSYTLKNVGPTAALSISNGEGGRNGNACRINPEYIPIHPNGGNGDDWSIPGEGSEPHTQMWGGPIARNIADRTFGSMCLIDQYSFYDVFGRPHLKVKCFRVNSELATILPCYPHPRQP